MLNARTDVSEDMVFRPLERPEERCAYINLLRATYQRVGIFSEKFLPSPDVVCCGVVTPDGTIAAICGLTLLKREQSAEFEQLIGLAPDEARTVVEVTNVVVVRSFEGGVAFPILCRGLAEHALAMGAGLIVGVTRSALLKKFVGFGLYPAVHKPLHLLGDPLIQDFVIYYDYHAPGAVNFMRARAAQVLEQTRRLATLRTQYMQGDGARSGSAKDDQRISSAHAN